MPASRVLAFVAFLLLVTALWMDWWVVDLADYQEGVRALGPEQDIASTAWRYAVAGLVAACCVVLFVRIAAGSHEHEPPKWRRDLWAATGLAAAALAATLLWPRMGYPFWGSGQAETVTSGPATFTTNPGLGWLAALAATACLAAAALLARREGAAPEALADDPLPQTPK